MPTEFTLLKADFGNFEDEWYLESDKLWILFRTKVPDPICNQFCCMSWLKANGYLQKEFKHKTKYRNVSVRYALPEDGNVDIPVSPTEFMLATAEALYEQWEIQSQDLLLLPALK